MQKITLLIFIIYGLFLINSTDRKNTNSHIKAYEIDSNTTICRSNKVFNLKSRGKHLIFYNNKPLFISYIVLREQGNNIKTFIIEELNHNRWHTIYKGEKIGEKSIIKINCIINHHLRLKVLKSAQIPYISSLEIITK